MKRPRDFRKDSCYSWLAGRLQCVDLRRIIVAQFLLLHCGRCPQKTAIRDGVKNKGRMMVYIELRCMNGLYACIGLTC
jgi:hypothetical protein